MNPGEELLGHEQLDYDTYIKDSTRLVLEPFVDKEMKILGLNFMYYGPFVIFYRPPENLDESGVNQSNFNSVLGIPT